MSPNPTVLWRVYRGSEPLQFGVSTRAGGNRFDPLPTPWDTTRVLYAATSPEAAIAETLLRWHDDVGAGAHVELERSRFEDRYLTEVRVTRELNVIDLTGFGIAPVQATLDADRGGHRAEDIFQCSSASYETTQAWGSWFRDQKPQADGLRWMSRQFNSAAAVVLFEDRCPIGTLETYGAAESLVDRSTAANRMLREGLDALRWVADC
jgi:hypothetical protein